MKAGERGRSYPPVPWTVERKYPGDHRGKNLLPKPHPAKEKISLPIRLKDFVLFLLWSLRSFAAIHFPGQHLPPISCKIDYFSFAIDQFAGNGWSMTVLFRCRIEKPLLAKANRVAEKLGTTTPEMVRMFVAQMARTGKVPLDLNATEAHAGAVPWEQQAATLESFYDKSKTW